MVSANDVMEHFAFPGNIRDFTNQNATQFENTETEKGPGREHRHEPREKQSYGSERDDRVRAVQIL